MYEIGMMSIMNKLNDNLFFFTGRRKKSKKKREEEMLLSYKDPQVNSESEQGTQTTTISSNFDDYPTTLPLPAHYRNGM